MSQWQPVSRGIDENEPTVVLGDEPTIGVPRLPEHTQVLDVSALQAAHEPPLQAPRGGDAEQEASRPRTTRRSVLTMIPPTLFSCRACRTVGSRTWACSCCG